MLVDKFLGTQRTTTNGGSLLNQRDRDPSNASFGMNNNSIYKLLSQSGNNSNIGQSNVNND
jgi:hypothetical protein